MVTGKGIKNKKIPVQMLVGTRKGIKVVAGTAIITNDEHGKTLSLAYDGQQMTITFEQIAEYLR